MNISGAYTQSYSFSLTLATVRVGTTPAAPGGEATAVSANQTPAQSSDTVTLSPEATTPSPAPAAPSPSAQKVDALLAALDADDDGKITKDEFRNGALALLGRRRGADDQQSVDGESGDRVREHHRSHRLERRLEKLFDRIDANDDGAVDASELTDALARVDARRAKEHAGGEAPQEPERPVAASASYASVTVVAVAVAVKQYAAIGAAA